MSQVEAESLSVDRAAEPRCPYDPARPGATVALPRSSAEMFMRRLLLGPATVAAESAQRVFSQSIAVSATRCLLTYILLPVVMPSVGAATGIGPAVGIPLGLIAMSFEVFSVPVGSWLADHRYRWLCTAIYTVVLSFLMFLLVHDVSELIG